MAMALPVIGLPDNVVKFKDFYEVLIHDDTYFGFQVHWTKDPNKLITRAVVWCKFSNSPDQKFYEESVRKHAEINVIKKLKQFVKSKKSITEVEIYINCSPCSRCSTALLQFKSEHVNVKMTIVFAGLYTILRKSCLESCIIDKRCCKHVPYINRSDSENNKQGLKKLRAEGVILRSFNFNDWLFLSNYIFRDDPAWGMAVLNLNDPTYSAARKQNTYFDLQQKLNQHYPWMIEISATQREQEDKRLLKDQNDIFTEAEKRADIGSMVPMDFVFPEPVSNPSITYGMMRYIEHGVPVPIVPTPDEPFPEFNDTSLSKHQRSLQVNAVSQANAGEYFCIAQLQNGTRVSSNTVKLTVVPDRKSLYRTNFLGSSPGPPGGHLQQ